MAETNESETSGPRNATFVAVDNRRWQEKLQRDLKGKTADDLAWTDVSGLTIEPLYNEGQSSKRRGMPGLGASWQVSVGIDSSDPSVAQTQAVEAARGGAEAVFVTLGAPDASTGVKFRSATEFETFCRSLVDAGLDIHLDSGREALTLASALNYASSLGIDPCRSAAQGQSQADVDALADLGFDLFTGGDCHGVPFTVNTLDYHGAGACHSLELALSFASGVHLLREAKARGVEIEQLAPLITFDVAVGTDFFSSIAKCRAARLGWMRIGEVLGIDGTMMLHVSPSVLHQTTRGRWVNTLRNTAYCFGGAVGGADRITLPSHEFHTKTEGDLGARIARNTQLVLRLESGLDQVKDAAAGSYYLERRTDDTVQRAWELFQQIEGQGGILPALASGWVANQIRGDRERRMADVEQGATPILGVSLYPSPDEKLEPPTERETTSRGTIRPRPLSWDVKGEGA